jgi:hypothetical protein
MQHALPMYGIVNYVHCQYGAELLLFRQISFTRDSQLVDVVVKALIYKYWVA